MKNIQKILVIVIIMFSYLAKAQEATDAATPMLTTTSSEYLSINDPKYKLPVDLIEEFKTEINKIPNPVGDMLMKPLPLGWEDGVKDALFCDVEIIKILNMSALMGDRRTYEAVYEQKWFYEDGRSGWANTGLYGMRVKCEVAGAMKKPYIIIRFPFMYERGAA